MMRVPPLAGHDVTAGKRLVAALEAALIGPFAK